jgi:hypothetical protein
MTTPAPICPVCKQSILDDEPVVSGRRRPPVHVRCWRPTDAAKDDSDEETGAA